MSARLGFVGESVANKRSWSCGYENSHYWRCRHIGSHACKVLARRGFEPIVFDNLSRGNRCAVKWGPLELGDIADSVRLRTVLEQYRPAALMHFAAYAYVGESVEDPLLYYQNNVAASAALLQTLLSFETIPVVFSSTCATYGAPETIPISEDHPQRADSDEVARV